MCLEKSVATAPAKVSSGCGERPAVGEDEAAVVMCVCPWIVVPPCVGNWLAPLNLGLDTVHGFVLWC